MKNLATYLSPLQFNEIMAQRPIAYVPFGTVEWHGPHLPLGVDTLKVEALVAQAVEITGGIVFPTVSWNRNSVRQKNGISYEGVEHICEQLLPGNIHFIAQDTFEALVRDMVSTCVQRGFKVVCIWSGHNAAHLNRDLPGLRAELTERYPEHRIYLTANEMDLLTEEILRTAGIDTRGDHAGKWETSITLARHPDLVDLSRLEGKDLDKPNLCVSNNGVLSASAELGEKIIEVCGISVGTHLLELLQQVAHFDHPLPQPMAGAYGDGNVA